MSDQDFDRPDAKPEPPAVVNPGYAALRIAKALTTADSHPDSDARARAEEKVKRWQSVLGNILSGAVEYGSRTPLREVPVWATPEVITGGFATGRLIAGGPIREHELNLLGTVPRTPDGEERFALNSYFLTDSGFARLTDLLAGRKFDIDVPEEGALLSIVWLAQNGHAAAARNIIDQILPFLDRLRFYPIPLDAPRKPVGAQVHVQNIGEVARSLAAMRPNQRMLAQKESVTVWAPLHDRVVAMFLETVVDDWPCRRYPADWAAKAQSLLADYAELRRRHTLGHKLERPNQHYAQLRDLLRKCAAAPNTLTGREVGRVRLILAKYREKRGDPGTARCVELRQRQIGDVAAPMFEAIGKAVLPRLSGLPQNEGLADIDPILVPVTQAEASAAAGGVPDGAPVPFPVRKRLERCLSDSVEGLVRRGLVTSGETIAALLPQLTSELRSASFADPQLQDLYAASYRPSAGGGRFSC